MQRKKIGLHDADGGRFPNLPLMKLSAYHKAQGDAVERFYLLHRIHMILFILQKSFHGRKKNKTCRK